MTAAPEIERMHPQSAETLRQLIELHGERRLIAAMAEIADALAKREKEIAPKNSTAGFAHSTNATLLRQLAPRLYA